MKFAVKLFHTLAFRKKTRISFQFQFKRSSYKLSQVNKTPITKETKISTLYVPGRYGGQMYQFMKPLIDVKYIEQNMLEIEKSCHFRGIDLDLKYALDVLNDWMSKIQDHRKIVEQLQAYEDDLKRLKELELNNEYDEVYKKRAECLDQVEIARNKLYDIEDIVMPLSQKIPNIVDLTTPVERNVENVCLKPHVSLPKSHSHVDIAQNLSMLEFNNISPTAYYLKGMLAELELMALNYFADKMQSVHFVPMACADFCKSFILEATGLDPHNFDESVPLATKGTLKSQGYNLVGGASFQSLCAYLVNMNISHDSFPIRYYACGRHYQANHRLASTPSLFSVVQSSCIQQAIITDKANEISEFNSVVNFLLSCYQSLEIPFRTVDVCVAQLNSTESRRVQLELWSPAQHEYMPVAHVSQRNDFVSKRLNITYGEKHAVNGYCSIIEGVTVTVPVLLGCLIENYVKSDQSIEFEKLKTLF